MNAEQIQNITYAENIKILSTQLNITRGERDRLHEEIARLQALGQEHRQNACDTICQIAHKNYDEMVKMDAEIALLRKENEELKSQRPRYTCPQDEDLTGGDANYQYYYAVDDGEMTIWKVPHHLAEVKSAKTSYHGAVEQLFYDESFGEEHGKLNYLIVREMKLKDLVSRKWKPAAEEEEAEEEAQAEQAFFEGKEGGVIRWKKPEEDEEEEEKEYDPLVMRGEDCDGYNCGNKLTTEEECRRVMCESCINIWKGFEKDGVPCELRSDLGAAIYAARNASEDSDDDEDMYVCGVCGKTEPKDVEWDVGAMEDFRGDVICPDCDE